VDLIRKSVRAPRTPSVGVQHYRLIKSPSYGSSQFRIPQVREGGEVGSALPPQEHAYDYFVHGEQNSRPHTLPRLRVLPNTKDIRAEGAWDFTRYEV
jgi:hypothetical protein